MNANDLGVVLVTSAIAGASTTTMFWAYDFAKSRGRNGLKSAIFAGAVSGGLSLISGMIAMAYYKSAALPPSTSGIRRLGVYMPEAKVVTYDNTVLRRY